LIFGSEPIFDDHVVTIETHTYNPYANMTFGHSDEIRILIQQQDLYTLPSDSFLYIKGKISISKETKNKVANELAATLANNYVTFMFDEIRYELNGMKIDHRSIETLK